MEPTKILLLSALLIFIFSRRGSNRPVDRNADRAGGGLPDDDNKERLKERLGQAVFLALVAVGILALLYQFGYIDLPQL